jgi:hypothetical protein
MRIAIRRLHLEHALLHLQNRNIERSATKIIKATTELELLSNRMREQLQWVIEVIMDAEMKSRRPQDP